MDRRRITLDDLDVPTLLQVVATLLAHEATAMLAADGFDRLRPSHGFVVQHLVDGPRRIGEVAERMGVTQQAASKSLRELEALGVVALAVDPADSRARRASLTPRGRQAVIGARRARSSVEADLRRHHGDGAVDALRALLVAELDRHGAVEDVLDRRVRA